jgi:uncharacterized protein
MKVNHSASTTLKFFLLAATMFSRSVRGFHSINNIRHQTLSYRSWNPQFNPSRCLMSTGTISGPDTQYMEIATRLWVERVVMGQGLCPWAAGTLVGSKLRICTINGGASGDESLLEVCEKIIEESRSLFEKAANNVEESSTTLIVLPEFKNFEAFLDLVDIIEGLFDKENIDEFLQVAHFHPDYVFADSDTPEAEIENYTNRSPFPIIHLLKVDEVTNAIDSYNNGDTSTIWKKNKVTLRALGIEKVKAIGKKILEDAALEVAKRESGIKF